MNIDRFSSQLNKHWSSISRYAELPIDEGNRADVNPSRASVEPPRPSAQGARANAQRSQQDKLKFEPKTLLRDEEGNPQKGKFDKDFSLGTAEKEPIMPHNSPDSAFPRRKRRKRVQMEPNLPAQKQRSLNTPTIPSREIQSPPTGFQKGARAGGQALTFQDQKAKEWQEKLPEANNIEAKPSDLRPPTPDIVVPGVQEVAEERVRGRQRAQELQRNRRNPDLNPPSRKTQRPINQQEGRQLPSQQGNQNIPTIPATSYQPQSRKKFQTSLEKRGLNRNVWETLSPDQREKLEQNIMSETRQDNRREDKLKQTINALNNLFSNQPSEGKSQQEAAKLASESDLVPPPSDFYQEQPESPDIYVDRDRQPQQEQAPSERLPFPDPSQVGKAPDTRSGEIGNAEARRPRKADISPDGMQGQFSDAEETRGQPADGPAQQPEQLADQPAEQDVVDAEAVVDQRPVSEKMLDDDFDAWEIKPDLTDKEFKETFGKTRGGMEREAHSMRRKKRILQFNRENRVMRDKDRAATRRWRRAMSKNTGALTGGLTNILGNFFINRSEQQNHARRIQFNEYMQQFDTEFVQRQADRSEANLAAKSNPLEPGGTYTESQFNAWYNQLPPDQQAVSADFLRQQFTIVPDGTAVDQSSQPKSVIDDLEDKLDARRPGDTGQPFDMSSIKPAAPAVHPHEENPELGEKAGQMLGDLADDELSRHDKDEILHHEQFENLHDSLKKQSALFMQQPYSPRGAESLARAARRLHLAGYETNVPVTVEGVKNLHKHNTYKTHTQNLFKRINRLNSLENQDKKSAEYRNLQNGIRIATKQIQDAGYGNLIDQTRQNLEELKEQQLNNKINSLFSLYQKYQEAVGLDKNAPVNHQTNINNLHSQFSSLVQSLQDETGEDIGELTSHLVANHPEIDDQDFRDLVDENSKPHQYVDVANSNLDKDEQTQLLEQMTTMGEEDEDEDQGQPIVSGEGQQLLSDFNVDVDGQINPPTSGSLEQDITPAVNVTTTEDDEDDPFVDDVDTAPVSSLSPSVQQPTAPPNGGAAVPVAPSPDEEIVEADEYGEDDEESNIQADLDDYNYRNNDQDEVNVEVEEADLQHPIARGLHDFLLRNNRDEDFWPASQLLARELDAGRLDEISNMDNEMFEGLVNGLLDQLDGGVINSAEEVPLSEDELESQQAHNAAVDRLVKDGMAEFYRLHTDNASQSDVMRYDPKDLVVNPERFQYKRNVDRKDGVTTDYKSTEEWNPFGGGVLLGWKDPEDGKMYVVNGHHRMEMAKRLNAPYVDVRPIEADSAKEARSIGALMNIMENQGTPLDTAAYMRETNSTLDDLKKVGLALKKSEIATAYNLSNLLDGLWQRVLDGNLQQNQASLIGGILPEGDQQEAFWKNHGKSVKEGMRLDNLERRLNITKSQLTQVDGKQQGGLFGEGQLEVKSPAFYDLLNKIETKAKKGMKTGKALQSGVTKEFAGDRNVLDDEQNAQQELANSRILKLGEMMGRKHEDEVFNDYQDQLTEAAIQIDNAPAKKANALLAEAVERIYKDIKFKMENAEDSMFYSAYGNALARISRQCVRRQFNIEQYMARKFTRQDHLQNRVAAFWEVELN